MTGDDQPRRRRRIRHAEQPAEPAPAGPGESDEGTASDEAAEPAEPTLHEQIQAALASYHEDRRRARWISPTHYR